MIDKEQQEALEKYGHFNSTHEVYGVLAEELVEFFWIVKEKPGTPKKAERMIAELNQIRAVAERAMNELKNDLIKFV